MQNAPELLSLHPSLWTPPSPPLQCWRSQPRETHSYTGKRPEQGPARPNIEEKGARGECDGATPTARIFTAVPGATPTPSQRADQNTSARTADSELSESVDLGPVERTCVLVCVRARARAWRRAEIDCLAAAGDLRIVRLHIPRTSPVHHPYIARTSPVHPPIEIPRENVFARIRRREDTPVLSFTT